ncbi:Spore coat polysaccharide biosynthesis protein SpsG, predicted glycosyltransferase [Thalassotalea agarivorans]|uniref:Spore coat polysaccharide biosynthesis protein SpsG, predicted glycosyltransferase n=1 Tax=Thalassotalea agarivorans TaxID=349064 RepID=A0A1I0HT57_THASX|nr:Spore coat polysaccharide biosynthesis protein SpsG, predicted glycosyltransferase [Thalassotalea agarivorans]
MLFIPVSSPEGMGEYMRSLLVADALQEKRANAEIAFILNERAPYTAHCPYTVFGSKGSATKDSKAVEQALKEFQPDVVIFDASGRAKQFKLAKRLGAKVVFISQHKKKRARGLKLNRLPYIDHHFVVQPSFCLPPLSLVARLKLRIFPAARPTHIDAVYNEPDIAKTQQWLIDHNLNDKPFVLLSAGSGGHHINGLYATELFNDYALQLSQALKLHCIVVIGPNYPYEAPENSAAITYVRALQNDTFVGLLKLAELVVISAGDTLVQSAAMQVPSLCQAIAKDQYRRLQQFQSEGLTLAVEPKKIVIQATKVMTLFKQQGVSSQPPLKNGLSTILEALMSN